MKYLITLLLFSTLSLVNAQTTTTFILVRHAEKGDDGTKDPDLTETGNARAKRLAFLLGKTQVDAIYSTTYKRTRHTVAPLATSKGISVTEYDAFKAEAIDKMLNKHHGGTVVISGHSNNIPWIANYLTGEQTYKDFADTEYENVLIVTVIEKGKNTKVVWLSY